MHKPSPQLSLLIQHYNAHNRSEGKSPKTVGWYQEVLDLFLRWLVDNGHGTTLAAMDLQLVREYVLFLQEGGVMGITPSSATMNNRVRALRAFFHWLQLEGYAKTHILQNMRPPKVAHHVVEPLLPEEIGRLFAAYDNNSSMGARNIAIISLMLDTGVRLSELTGLKAMNVHLEDGWIKVLGKGNKERMVAFGSTVQKTLIRYQARFRPQLLHAGVEEFFLNEQGGPLTPNSIQTLFLRLRRAVDIPRFHAHLLRHTYATNFLLNSGNVILLQHNLGHTTLAMVNEYVHMASGQMAITSREFSPLDHMHIKEVRKGVGRIGHPRAGMAQGFMGR